MKHVGNDNHKYPWSNAKYPDMPGNSFNSLYRRCRVSLNGEDVTSRCWFYDTEFGVAGLYLHKDGKPYYDSDVGGVAVEWRRGTVEVFVSDGVTP